MTNLLALISKYSAHILAVLGIGTAVSFGAFAPTGGGTYRLQSSVGTSDTSITLSSFKEPVSNIKYTMSYIGTDILFGTLDPQTSKPEFISATGVTQNADGTALLTGVTRGLSRSPAGSSCVSSTTLAQSHSAQSIFILSDSPCFFTEYLPARTTATSSAILIFGSTTPPRYDSTAAQNTGTYIATTSEFASIDYVNRISFSGVSNATESVKGIAELATATENASSTPTGSTGASLVPQSKHATSTPTWGCDNTSTVGKLCLVAAGLTGKISQTFFNLTEEWGFTALTATRATTTNATTTNFAITGSPFHWNGLNYRGPGTHTASSTLLMNNGSGSLSWNLPAIYVVSQNGTVQSTGSTATTTAYALAIPADTFGTNGMLKLEFLYSGTGTTDEKDFDILWGNGSSTTTIPFQCLDCTLASNQVGKFTMEIYANNSVSAQTLRAEYQTQLVFGTPLFRFQGTNTTYSTAAQTYITINYRVRNAADTATIRGYTLTRFAQ